MVLKVEGMDNNDNNNDDNNNNNNNNINAVDHNGFTDGLDVLLHQRTHEPLLENFYVR